MELHHSVTKRTHGEPTFLDPRAPPLTTIHRRTTGLHMVGTAVTCQCVAGSFGPCQAVRTSNVSKSGGLHGSRFCHTMRVYRLRLSFVGGAPSMVRQLWYSACGFWYSSFWASGCVAWLGCQVWWGCDRTAHLQHFFKKRQSGIERAERRHEQRSTRPHRQLGRSCVLPTPSARIRRSCSRPSTADGAPSPRPRPADSSGNLSFGSGPRKKFG